MYRVIGLHIRIYITVCMVAIMSCLAITAKAGQFDYDAAMEKATTEINGKKYIGASTPSRKSAGTPFRTTTNTANIYFTQPPPTCIMNRAIL